MEPRLKLCKNSWIDSNDLYVVTVVWRVFAQGVILRGVAMIALTF